MSATAPALTKEDLDRTRAELLAQVKGEVAGTVQSELAKEREARERAEAEARRPKADPSQTAEQLQSLVDQGVLTPLQSQDKLTQQRMAAMREELRNELMSERSTGDRLSKITTEIQRYRTALPQVMQSGTAERGRAEKEFQGLRTLGYPDDITTELLALRAAFGDPEPLEERTRSRRETHEETSGGAGGGKDEGGAATSVPAGITPRLREFYASKIQSGIYQGWDDPVLKKELGLVRQAKKAAA